MKLKREVQLACRRDWRDNLTFLLSPNVVIPAAVICLVAALIAVCIATVLEGGGQCR